MKQAHLGLASRMASFLLAIGLLLPMCVPASAAAAPQQDMSISCATSKVINYAMFDVTVTTVRMLFETEQFAQLDQILACLMESNQRFLNGKSGASAVYWVFRKEMPAPGTNDFAVKRANKWTAERPDSIFAQFAQLRLMYAAAWKCNCGNVAYKGRERDLENYRSGLLDTESALNKASPQLKETPLWHNLLLAVVQDTNGTKSTPDAVFEEGIRRWPDYYDFYEVRLSRLVPAWGGSWEEVDQFITGWSAKKRGLEGDSMYARLYTSVVIGGARPSDTKIVWPRMKKSLDELVARYPDTAYMNLAASYACGYGDTAYFKKSMQRIGKQSNPYGWLPGADLEECVK